jgi:hypothetical protein
LALCSCTSNNRVLLCSCENHKCRKYSLLLPSSVIGEWNGGVVSLELKLVVSVTMPSDFKD